MITFLISIINLLSINKTVDAAYCDIKGNVKNPGVYLVEKGEVINDIIIKAGGLKKNSYVKNINLSKKVTDEMVISIISIDDYKELTKECPICNCIIPECNKSTTQTTSTTLKTEINITNQNSTTLKIEPKPTTQVTTSTTIVTTKPNTSSINTTQTTTNANNLIININTGSIDELVLLPGIGEATAKKIIEYRENKIFECIEDILNVKGIGYKLFEKIKEHITV